MTTPATPPPSAALNEALEDVRSHFDGVATEYDRLTAKSHRFHRALVSALRAVVPPGRRVLEVGTATGDMLAAMEPSDGLGIDLSSSMVERARLKHPRLRFLTHNILDGPLDERFEYVVSVNLMEHVPDMGLATRIMAEMLEPAGVMLNITPHPVWALPIYVADRMHVKVPEGRHWWRSKQDLIAAGRDAGLQLRSFDRDFVIPREIPGIARVNTARWARPVRQSLGIIQRAVFEKPRPSS